VEITFIKNVLANGREISVLRVLKSLVVSNSPDMDLTVVYCRARWDDGAPTGKGKGNVDSDSNEGYLNLGRLCGLSQHRGTSLTYSETNPRYLDISLSSVLGEF